ncbi:MAG: hypothetical protein ACE5FS_16600 [Paracoccaceae bacterium]
MKLEDKTQDEPAIDRRKLLTRIGFARAAAEGVPPSRGSHCAGSRHGRASAWVGAGFITHPPSAFRAGRGVKPPKTSLIPLRPGKTPNPPAIPEPLDAEPRVRLPATRGVSAGLPPSMEIHGVWISCFRVFSCSMA